MADHSELLQTAASIAASYRRSLDERPVNAWRDVDKLRAGFGGPLPTTPAHPGDVLEALVDAAAGGLVATAGPRYFGFVIGGALEAATAADIVATGWRPSHRPSPRRGLRRLLFRSWRP